MSNKKKVVAGLGALLAVGLIVVLVAWARTLGPKNQASGAPTSVPTSAVRKLGNERFGPHIRAQTAANVDVGVLTARVTRKTSPTPSPAKTQVGLATPAQQLAQDYGTPSPSPLASASARPTSAPPATPPPILPPLKFEPLVAPLVGQERELIVVYSKGDTGKRQIYLRSVERDKDEQLVTDAYDDYGVSICNQTQKVAYYSDEEGPSDETKSRTKLKVVDLGSGKVTPIASGLPGTWPVAWSSDCKKMAIPTRNTIYIADTTTGTSLQVPTSKNPGAIVWAPGGLQFYYQAEASPGNNDIFAADAITAQPRTVVSGSSSETYPSVSSDGGRLSFIRTQQSGSGTVVTKTLPNGAETNYPETSPVDSYLWNLDYKQLVFVKNGQQPKLSLWKDKNVVDLGNLEKPIVVSWDRDYGHVFVLAADDKSRALFSVDISTGKAEKIKGGISDTVPDAGTQR